jgi:3-methylcrotonyl-CoA carboxylase alpha subunit
MFSKILIANRGEIAVRIIQTCREMGIEPVAVYSEADRSALHVRMADSAYYIGPAPARDSYLNVPEVVEAAVRSGAEAIHPGYGFLAENATFAEAVVSAGLAWIGPPASVISLLGDKVAAKRAAEEAGVLVVPGYAGDDLSRERLAVEAERIGYPVMLKAAAGGGGKGMRVVDRPEALRDSIGSAQREAAAAFGDDRIFMEKLLVRPRHVEMQILADSAGSVVYLGERDCSLQRRHQKVVEEAPGPVMTQSLRTAMGEAAVRIARVSRYVNAGTVEFLLAGDDFYFLEVNTRIQVEHPVTEATSGLDLIRLQLAIAAGEPLSFTQIDVAMRGHAIEARIYAEDPDVHFLPSTGLLEIFSPPLGPGIRNDVGVEAGDAITTHYDPMMAKLIVCAENRVLAVTRLQEALDRYVCVGPKTNLEFLRWIAREPAFVAGNLDIGFIDRDWRPEERHMLPSAVLIAAALADAAGLVATNDPWRRRGAWRMAGMPRRLRYEYEREVREINLISTGQSCWRITMSDFDQEITVLDVRANTIVYRSGERITTVSVSSGQNGYSLVYEGMLYDLSRPHLLDAARTRVGGQTFEARLTAPMPGTIVSIPVTEGQRVQVGEPLIVMEAMKMEHIVEATSAGTIGSILVQPGEMVAAGAALVQMEA